MWEGYRVFVQKKSTGTWKSFIKGVGLEKRTGKKSLQLHLPEKEKRKRVIKLLHSNAPKLTRETPPARNPGSFRE